LLNSGCGGQDDEQKDDKLECGSGTEFKIDEDADDELDKVEIPSKRCEVKEDKVEGCDSLQLIISLEDKYTNTILII
jgi:hypothetical protein